MSQEEKQGEASQAEAGAQATDYEAQYKALQKEHETAVRQRDEATSQVDLLSEYVDWDKVQGVDTNAQPAKTEQEPKGIDTAQVLGAVDTKLMALQWRIDHPELKEYETTLVSPALGRLKAKHPRTPPQKLLEMATQEVTDFISAQEKKAEAKLSEKKKAEVNAGGLDSESTTSPTPKPGGQTPEEYLAERLAAQAKKLQL